MSSEKNPASFAASNWIEALLEEYEEEAKMEARWPTLLLHSSGRKLMWYLCSKLDMNCKGMPGSACRLFERYLSRHIRTFLQETRGADEWERYKDMLATRFHLLMVSCIQLVAKMNDLLAPLSTSTMRTALMKEGIVHTKAEIVDMEYHVYSTLDFRIPLWTTLEIAEFLATQVGLGAPTMIEAVDLVVNLAEFHRRRIELHLRCWSETPNTNGSSSSSRTNKASLHNLHLCAGAVSATAKYMRASVPDATERLATIIRTNFYFIKAISDTILYHIIPDKKHIPILKKRRLR